MATERLAGRPTGSPARAPLSERRADFGSTVALTVTLALAAFLALMAIVVLLAHPQLAGLGPSPGLVNKQNQTGKSLLYLVTFAVILPTAVILVPRLADAIAAGRNGAALGTLSALIVSSLALLLIAIRLSHRLPWGDGLKVVLVGALIWSAVAGATLARSAAGGPWPALVRLAPCAEPHGCARACWCSRRCSALPRAASLHAVPLLLGALLGVALLLVAPRLRTPGGRRGGRVIDVVMIVVLALAIPNVIVYTSTGALPNIYFPPGVIADQQNYLLGSANQLLGGGALLVNVPVSQYGVGLIYFLDGWFHLVHIGYGTAGLLDGTPDCAFVHPRLRRPADRPHRAAAGGRRAGGRRAGARLRAAVQRRRAARDRTAALRAAAVDRRDDGVRGPLAEVAGVLDRPPSS